MATSDTRVRDAPARQRRSVAAFFRTDPVSTAITLAVDAVSAAAAVALATLWASSTQDAAPPFGWATLFVPLVMIALAARSMYRRNLDRRLMDELGPVETTIMFAAMLILTGMTFANVTGRPGALMSKVWICATVLMPAARLLHVSIQRRLRHGHRLVSPALIIGNGRIAHQITERLIVARQYGLAPVGLLSVEEPWSGPDGDLGARIPRLGPPDAIEDVIATTGAEAVIIAFSVMQDQLLTRVVRIAHRHGVRVWVVPRMFDVVGQRVHVEHIGGLPLLALNQADPRGWQFAVKHLSDRLVAGVGLLAISPLMLLLVVLVRASSPGPVFFRQQRVGRDGQVFDCLKFRTMRTLHAADDAAHSGDHDTAPGGIEGADRRTALGRFLRSTSMDELPQLINVVKGEMSLVGPRPERPEFVDQFQTQVGRYEERHRVKAGMTGWAQVHGLRGQTSIRDRAEWDNFYIENWSLALDMKILALTVPAVLRRAE